MTTTLPDNQFEGKTKRERQSPLVIGKAMQRAHRQAIASTDPKLTGRDWKVLAAIENLTLAYHRLTDTIFAAALQKESGLDDHAVRKAVQRLKKANVITYEPSGGRHPSLYGFPTPGAEALSSTPGVDDRGSENPTPGVSDDPTPGVDDPTTCMESPVVNSSTHTHHTNDAFEFEDEESSAPNLEPESAPSSTSSDAHRQIQEQRSITTEHEQGQEQDLAQRQQRYDEAKATGLYTKRQCRLIALGALDMNGNRTELWKSRNQLEQEERKREHDEQWARLLAADPTKETA